MDFLQKLDLLMKKNNLNKHSLAEQCGIPYTTIVGLYTKGYEKIKLPTVQKLADFFGTSIDYLMREEINDQNYGKENVAEVVPYLKDLILKFERLDAHGKEVVDNIINVEIKRIEQEKHKNKTNAPVNKAIVITYNLPASAGTGAFLDSDDYEHIEYPADDVPYGTDFAVKIQGNSMEPDYIDGSVAFVRKQTEINDGDIGIFVLNGEGYIKQIEHRGANVYLVSLNPAYDDIKVLDTDDFRCSGKVLN